MLIRSCFFSLPLDAALEDTPTKYSKVRATAEGEGQHFRWGLWNTGISSRLPSLQLLLSMFSRKGLRKFGQKSFPMSPIDWTLISPFPYSPPSHTHTTHLRLSSQYVTQLPALYTWFLQAHRGLLLTIINRNHNQSAIWLVTLILCSKIALQYLLDVVEQFEVFLPF